MRTKDSSVIKNRVKEERIRKNISQSTLSEGLNLSVEQIQNIESNVSNLTIKNAISIANILDVPMHDLLVEGGYAPGEEYNQDIFFKDKQPEKITAVLDMMLTNKYNRESDKKDKEVIYERLIFSYTNLRGRFMAVKRANYLSTAKMAKALNIQESTIRGIENGKKPSMGLMVEISNLFKVPIDVFFENQLHNRTIVNNYKLELIFKDCSPSEKKSIINTMEKLVDQSL